jgi:hypothetical protein
MSTFIVIILYFWSILTCTFTKSTVEKYRVLYRVHVTNYFHGQNSIFGHMPLYITISVKSYNLLTQLFHISFYQNEIITLSRTWHLYFLYTVYQWHHSIIFELWSVLWSAMVKLFTCHPTLNQPKLSNFAPEWVQSDTISPVVMVLQPKWWNKYFVRCLTITGEWQIIWNSTGLQILWMFFY